MALSPSLPMPPHSPAPTYRLGLFGGSFNPIHKGHLAVARETVTRLDLDRLLFIPSGDPPHKPHGSLAPAQDRYEMVRLAIAGAPKFEASDIEITRRGKSYTIDTVRELRQLYGPSTALYFIIGLDAFLDLPTWREPDALLSACTFVVMSRPGQSYRTLASVPFLTRVDPRRLEDLDAGKLSQLELPTASGGPIICLPLRPLTISASDIRRRINRGESLANLLPPQVESYILQHKLYREDHDRTHI